MLVSIAIYTACTMILLNESDYAGNTILSCHMFHQCSEYLGLLAMVG